jgi:exodeoxyribonuclease VII large subunit
MKNPHIYTVSELTKAIKFFLQDQFPEVWIQGEISNFTKAKSGHIYFSLKDESSQIQCVMFHPETKTLRFSPEDGIQVKGFGRIDVYEKRGSYQFYVETLTPLGIGELAIRFEELKKRLSSEGLFDPDRKKPLPFFPERIGIVTSPTGAAIQDILNILRRRQRSVEIVVKPVRVQGDGAANEIAQAIDEFNQYGRVDLLIVGRGGGSIEDLWAFNEEVVARAISRSDIPVISAVGHEIDYTIADFVSDLRAPTPSGAAELAVRDKEELFSEIEHLLIRAGNSLEKMVVSSRERVRSLLKSYGFRRPLDLVVQYHQTLDDCERRLNLLWDYRLQSLREGVASEIKRLKGASPESIIVRHRETIGGFERRLTLNWSYRLQSLKNSSTFLEKRLEGVSPEGILFRGYSITYKLPKKHVVRNSEELKSRDRIETQFHKGRVISSVEEKEE